MSFLKNLLFTIVLFTVFVSAQEKKVPDYSTTPRKDVPVEYTWKLEDIYPTKEAWYKDKDEVMGMLKSVDEKSKDWTSSAQKMVEVFKLSDLVNQKFGRLFNYAGHHAQCRTQQS